MNKKTPSRVKQLRDLLDDAISIGDDDQIQILRAELESINSNYKDGGNVKSSAQTSVIKGAQAKSSAQGSTIPGAPAKGSAEGSVIKMNSGGLAKRGYGKASAEPLYSKKKEADFEKGIYSYVKHRKTPSSTQHKEMIDSQKVKYKGLTNKQIVAKAMKSGDIRKLKSTESKKSQRIKKKTIDDYKQGGIIKMKSGGLAKRGYGKARR
jgi:hypothetical protein|tara:strand:+ start:56 stop:679 length:624 start_codon:yes stop_codon:yes gene_type:complete